ncbi:unnamed protein product, partial [Rotaria sp. Silwood2]
MVPLEWRNTGSMIYRRYYHTASALTNGKVLVTGGLDNGSYLNSAELYDPLTGLWTATANMNITRTEQTASVLTNGKVLVTGGVNNSSYLKSAK